MKYSNPVITGFHPDPSVCVANGKFYLVCSSFQYFPGVPLFESDDLVNWHKIGHVLTRESQLPLEGAGCSGGIYAPTIRFNDGRFYMITTNVNGGGNFLVWTDDIYGEWSDPVFIDKDGIDPSLYFEDGKVYFTSNYTSPDGVLSVRQREIDVLTGEALSEDKYIWHGTGGRYLEGPHLYKINGEYYLLAAEGGTEYGHMIVYAKGPTPYGPFESYPGNPVLTNRNNGDYLLQAVGHGDMVMDNEGNYWMVHLAFRQMRKWVQHHTLGREVCLVPVYFGEDGWFSAGKAGFTYLDMEVPGRGEGVIQRKPTHIGFEDKNEWVRMRNPFFENYKLTDGVLTLTATDVTLDNSKVSPTAIFTRQKEMSGEVSVDVLVRPSSFMEAGITVYMDECHHYDFAIRVTDKERLIIKRRTVGDMQYVQQTCPVSYGCRFIVEPYEEGYRFKVVIDGAVVDFGHALGRYLSSETVGGFTGVVFGIYATGNGEADFSNFSYDFEV